MRIVDARGLLCPEPVVLTQIAMKDGASAMTVLVDAVAAKENVSRFAASRGFSVAVSEKEGSYQLELTKE